MTAVVLPLSEPIVAPPVGADGEPLEFCWLSHESAIFAATATDLIGALLPGYADLVAAGDDAGLLELRVDAVTDLAALAQDAALAEAQAQLLDDDPDDPHLPEDVLTVLLTAKDGEVVELDEWPLPLPLYLLTTQYAPYTDTPAPKGEAVVLLDPVSETRFLHALMALGAGRLVQRTTTGG